MRTAHVSTRTTVADILEDLGSQINRRRTQGKSTTWPRRRVVFVLVKRRRGPFIVNTRWITILIIFLLTAIVFRTLRSTLLQFFDFRSKVVDNLLMERCLFLDTKIYSAETRPQCVDSNYSGTLKSWIWWVLGWWHHK
jgi:hypothetical protein